MKLRYELWKSKPEKHTDYLIQEHNKNMGGSSTKSYSSENNLEVEKGIKKEKN